MSIKESAHDETGCGGNEDVEMDVWSQNAIQN